MKTYYTSYSLTHFFSGVKNRAEFHDLRMLVYLDIKKMYLNIFSLFTLSVSVLLKEDMSMKPIKIFFLHFVKSPVLSEEPILLIFSRK